MHQLQPQSPTSPIRPAARLSLATITVIVFFAWLSVPRTAAALTAAQAILVYQGFQEFNTQTFNGNGRTWYDLPHPRQ